MPTYRVYRIMEMHGYQDVEARTEREAIDKVADDEEPENWSMNGYGSGNQFYVYSKDGKPIQPQSEWTVCLRKERKKCEACAREFYAANASVEFCDWCSLAEGINT